eukprot:5919964-Ditylum_brightwellii.AAC.1
MEVFLQDRKQPDAAWDCRKNAAEIAQELMKGAAGELFLMGRDGVEEFDNFGIPRGREGEDPLNCINYPTEDFF